MSSETYVRFGPFLFDPESGELWRDGEPVKLQPQPARLLALLIQRTGRAVSREEIQDHLWGETQVDAEAGVNFAVRRVRKALGERAGESRFVETLPRLGYRFIAPLEKVEGRRERSVEPTPRLLRRPRWWLVPVAVGVLLMGVLRPGSQPMSDPVDPEAQGAYLRGLYLLKQQDPEVAARAAGFFRRAVAADPTFAAAYVQLERADRDSLAVEERERLLEQARALDPGLPGAPLGLGWLELGTRLDAGAARDAFEAALALDPALPEAYHGSALAHAALGELETAIARVDQGLELDPGSTLIQGDAALVYFWAGRTTEAVALLEESLDLLPQARDVRWAAGTYLAAAGRRRLAVEITRPLIHPDSTRKPPVIPADAEAEVWRRQVQFFYEGAAEYFRRHVAPIPAGSLAECYLILGRHEEALEWLERAAEQGWYGMVYLGVDFRWDPVRRDPRFLALLARINSPPPESPAFRQTVPAPARPLPGSADPILSELAPGSAPR